MNFQIKLKKLLQEDLELFKAALQKHSNALQWLLESTENKVYAKDFSIAVELWHEINKRTVGQHPAEKAKLNLSLHKGYVLLDALKSYSCENISILERSRCNRFYLAMDQELPTFTQLAISNPS